MKNAKKIISARTLIVICLTMIIVQPSVFGQTEIVFKTKEDTPLYDKEGRSPAYKDTVYDRWGNLFSGIGFYTYPGKQFPSKYEIEDGVRNGESIDYYDDGSIRAILKWKDNLKNGFAKSFHKSGELSFQRFYINSVYDGEAISYYKSGQIRGTQYYDNDTPIGTHIEFFEDGTVKRIEVYDEGKLIAVK